MARSVLISPSYCFFWFGGRNAWEEQVTIKTVVLTKDFCSSSLLCISLSLVKTEVSLSLLKDLWGKKVNEFGPRPCFGFYTAADRSTKMTSSWKILNLKPENNPKKIFFRIISLLHSKLCVFPVLTRNIDIHISEQEN